MFVNCITTEEQKKFAVFSANMEKARKLQITERGTATYGASPLADLTGKTSSQSNVWFSHVD